MITTHIFKPRTLSEAVLNLKKRRTHPRLSVLNKDGQVKNYSSREYYKQIERLAKAYVESGISKGDRIGIFSNTRHEWSVCDLAATCIGAITIPIYPNLTSEDLIFILNESQCALVFVENRSILRQIMVVKEKCPHLRTIVIFDPPPQLEGDTWISLNEFISGAAFKSRQSFNFEARCRAIDPKDIVTIIYTSGTTGTPKGVILNHHQILSEVFAVFSALQITKRDHTLSFLPYSHVLGRIEHWGHIIIGYRITFSSGVERLIEDLQLAKPTVIATVPRITEKLYVAMKARIETSLIDSRLYRFANTNSWKWPAHIKFEPVQFLIRKISQSTSHWIVEDRIKSSLFGPHFRFIISGGAANSSEILTFFKSCGVPILEGYGLTETAGAVCINRPYENEIGTVGKPIENVLIKIKSDGEIWIKSPSIMKGYLRPEDTKESLREDGWLATGDIGELTKAGNLVIKDRKKDLIKTNTGKYIAPQRLENLCLQLPYVSHVHIHGDHRNFIVALFTLNRSFLFSLAREKKIPFHSIEDLKENPYITELIRQGVIQVNSNLASHETIKNYAVLSEDFSIEGGEITPSLKVRRRYVDQKYHGIIESLYT